MELLDVNSWIYIYIYIGSGAHSNVSPHSMLHRSTVLGM